MIICRLLRNDYSWSCLTCVSIYARLHGLFFDTPVRNLQEIWALPYAYIELVVRYKVCECLSNAVQVE